MSLKGTNVTETLKSRFTITDKGCEAIGKSKVGVVMVPLLNFDTNDDE